MHEKHEIAADALRSDRTHNCGLKSYATRYCRTDMCQLMLTIVPFCRNFNVLGTRIIMEHIFLPENCFEIIPAKCLQLHPWVNSEFATDNDYTIWFKIIFFCFNSLTYCVARQSLAGGLPLLGMWSRRCCQRTPQCHVDSPKLQVYLKNRWQAL